jgi:hypothetical protein
MNRFTTSTARDKLRDWQTCSHAPQLQNLQQNKVMVHRTRAKSIERIRIDSRRIVFGDWLIKGGSNP